MADLNLQGRILAQKYELVRLIGQGGMGAVYEARNHLGKRFAVKLLLKAEFAQDPNLAARFFREAKASAAIESEHIVEVYDTGVDPETSFPFIIMELLKGEDLEHTIQRVGALHPMAGARVIAQAAVGLSKAHQAGIVHRDIEPANIFMCLKDSGDAVVKILDFGIAKHAMDALNSGDQGLTKTGSMLGTPLYMSPEQAQGAKNLDARSDVWSLCMCLYEALSGSTPWGEVDTLGGLILAICSREVRPLQEAAPWVPPELALVVHRGLTRDMNQRIPSAAALVEMLKPFCGNTFQVTPEILVSVNDQQRSTVAPRADVGHLSVAGITASQPTASTMSAKKKSVAPLVAALGLFAVVAIGGGIFAVSQMSGSSDKKGNSHTTATSDDRTATTKETETASKKHDDDPPPQPVDTTKTAALSVKMPKGSTIKVGKEDMTGKLVDGKLSLTGEVGQGFIVTIWHGKENLLTQKVYMDDGFLVPEEIDTVKGEQTVKPPVVKPTGAKNPAAPTSSGTGKTTATGGAPPPPPTTTSKPPVTIASTFE